MKNKISDSDQIFVLMKSKLISYLEKSNPDFLCETDFIAIKADDATMYYDKLINSGIDKEKALQQALSVLLSSI